MNIINLSVGDWVKIAGGSREYEVAEVRDFPHGIMVGIYDEPPSDHVDFWNPTSLTLARKNHYESAKLETKLFILKNKVEGTIDGLRKSADELRAAYKGDKTKAIAAEFFAEGVLSAAKAVEKAIKEVGT